MKSMLSRFIACGLVLGFGFESTGLASRRTDFTRMLDEYNAPYAVQELEYLENDSTFKECANDVLRRYAAPYYVDEHNLEETAQQICEYATYTLNNFFGELRNRSNTETLLHSVTIEMGQSEYQEMTVFDQRMTIEAILQRALSIVRGRLGDRAQDSVYELSSWGYAGGPCSNLYM